MCEQRKRGTHPGVWRRKWMKKLLDRDLGDTVELAFIGLRLCLVSENLEPWYQYLQR